MFRHVSLRRSWSDGRHLWQLLGPNGQPIAAFTAFAEALRNSAPNTCDSYCRHLAQFFDFFIEATILFGDGRPLSKLRLIETLEAYGDYLLLGADASHPVAREIACSLPPGKTSPSSLIPKKAALRRFLRLSDDIRQELVEIGHYLDSEVLADEFPLFGELTRRRQLRAHEVRAMQANSMIAGVVAGGPKLIDAVPLGTQPNIVRYDEARAFPYDKVMDLIDAMPTYRDKAFYSFLAASGCRSHEGLQLLLDEDIDVEEGEARLVDPATRPGHESYRYLSPIQRRKLAWKGRSSDLTLLIEPFATIFFESLKVYLAREYLAHGRHNFIFQYSEGGDRGLPYFLSAAGSRLEQFHRVCKRLGVKLPEGSGPHSLRHMYGTYVLNYFPRSNGDYGLPVSVVQQLLGHSDVNSTLKYARFDNDLKKLEIQAANKILFRCGIPKTLLELKAQALESQLGKIRRQLTMLRDGRGN
ncbi:site-specific integrase [Burkholderia sp. Bp9125]|nr:site-specific integrase [Burkholderia sp. Bp9125]